VRLAKKTLANLADRVDRYRYDRDRQKTGVVHFGIGAFMRAHQAVYTDDAMNAGDTGWLTTGVSLRSPLVRDQLAPQDGLYMVAEKSGQGTAYRLIGSVSGVLVAPESPDQVISAISNPKTQIVTLTVTEKGYRRAKGGRLDLGAEDIASDLAGSTSPRTIYGFLAAGLAQRRKNSTGGLTLVSCDNLASNGEVLHSLMDQFLAHLDPELGGWFNDNCACPSTMVDRIVPATTEADRAAAEEATGLCDEGLVVTEPYRQWVVEDRFVSGRPRWEAGGAQFVSDVAPFETAKLRMLNGAHSALAYLGLEHGHTFVHEAVRDPTIRPLVEHLMVHEAAPTIDAAPGQDLVAYASALLSRFENPALQHRLDQIAMDGSQKIPQRWLATLAERQGCAAGCPSILCALAAWMRHVQGDGIPVDDPMADPLRAAWDMAGTEGIIDAIFGKNGLVNSDWHPLPAESTALLQAIKEFPHG